MQQVHSHRSGYRAGMNLSAGQIHLESGLGALAETPTAGSSGISSSFAGMKGRQFQDAKREVLTRFERDYFAALAEESKGNVSEMARRAGMERRFWASAAPEVCAAAARVR